MPAAFQPSHLPVESALPELMSALTKGPSAVLVAPPGAGKTTRVPIALLGAPWLQDQKILLLEPRRIAARGAADFMSRSLGEDLGKTIGIRSRLFTRIGPATRIEVITEGVFTRMILGDPSLQGIGAVIFDEFHERSLDADLGLALAIDAQSALRPDLKIIVMSATLDAARVARLLDDAPVVRSDGRAFAVETRYLGRSAGRIEDDVAAAVKRALAEETGSILAFLPGQAEIKRTAERLQENFGSRPIDIAPLYGTLDIGEQRAAIAPSPPGRRKVVLATSIAETSLTIQGVRVVIDSGLARVPRFEPDAGVTRLETVRVSRAAADQRRGRAGRTEAGVCYRLWDEPETQGLIPFAEPEIKSADLAALVLDCAEWGARDLKTLRWLDSPGDGVLAATRNELRDLGALDEDGAITQEGRRMRSLPLPPRLAHMILDAARFGAERSAAEIAAVLSERGIGGSGVDLDLRLEAFRRDRGPRAADLRRLSETWAKIAKANVAAENHPLSTAQILALGYSERIAKARGAPGHFLLANGRAGVIAVTEPLARAPFLVVAELTGKAAATRIVLAAEITESEIVDAAGAAITETNEVLFDESALALRARVTRRLGAITLSSEARAVEPSHETAEALAEGIARAGINRLPWSKEQLQLRARVAFLRRADGDWPDLSDGALAADVGALLAPFLMGKTRVSEVTAETLGHALDAQVPWALKAKLETEAPTHFTAPTGNRHALDYEGEGAPALHIRVQELFGLAVHPAIAGGRLPLTLMLLSPAHRPIQITRDLPGFWAGSWRDVKAEMRGRYPRHVWPDDPLHAEPTARAKRRAGT